MVTKRKDSSVVASDDMNTHSGGNNRNFSATASDDEYDIQSSPRLGRAFCCASFLEAFDNDDYVVEGNAFDIIMMKGDDSRLYQNSDFLVNFPGKVQKPSHRIVLEVRRGGNSNNNNGEPSTGSSYGSSHSLSDLESSDKAVWFPILQSGEDEDEIMSKLLRSSNRSSWNCCPTSVLPTGTIIDSNGAKQDVNDKLASCLHLGRNRVRYLLLDNNRVLGVAHSNIFVWSRVDRIVVMDIDGTITKSNARGILDTIVTENYQYCHEGVCSMLSRIRERYEHVKMIYVTSRPLTLACHTRKFLKTLEQGSSKLPPGPILGFGGSLPQLLVMELVSRKTHHFKAEMLWKQVVKPFREMMSDAPSASPVFAAGFGNTIMDVQAYHMAGIDLDKIYMINKNSRITAFDKKVDQEWLNLTATSSGMLGATVGVPRPRNWYKTLMGNSFRGYTDQDLLDHLFMVEEENETSNASAAPIRRRNTSPKLV